MAIIKQLYRYPLKGGSPESLSSVAVEVSKAIKSDRYLAFAHQTTSFNPLAPQHHPKTDFLMLMKNEKLSALQTSFDETTRTLHIQPPGAAAVSGQVDTAAGRQRLEDFMVEYLGSEIPAPPKLVYAQDIDYTFSDVAARVISCINLATLRELEPVFGKELHPLRFRANLYFDGGAAFEELDWIGKTFQLGTATVKVLKAIERCAATDVNPETAQRDLQIPQTLIKTFGHRNCGIYVQVIEAGEISVNQTFEIPTA